MNDRYLYRAKRIDNGEWVAGYYALIGNKHVIISKESEGYYTEFVEERHGYEIVNVDPLTICQCTGLNDKNGKLIWENDIVKHYNNQDYPETYDLGIIYWDNYKSGFERTSRTAKENVRINDSCIYEVIGSAFDNPELLEVEE